MNTRLAASLLTALLAGVLVSAAADAQAGAARGRRVAQPARRANAFAVAAEYTGPVGGVLRLDGVDYRVAPEATVYVVGEGLRDQGYFARGAALYVTGERVGGAMVVRSILVRQAAVASGDAGAGSVGVVPKGSPF